MTQPHDEREPTIEESKEERDARWVAWFRKDLLYKAPEQGVALTYGALRKVIDAERADAAAQAAEGKRSLTLDDIDAAVAATEERAEPGLSPVPQRVAELRALCLQTLDRVDPLTGTVFPGIPAWPKERPIALQLARAALATGLADVALAAAVRIKRHLAGDDAVRVVWSAHIPPMKESLLERLARRTEDPTTAGDTADLDDLERATAPKGE